MVGAQKNTELVNMQEPRHARIRNALEVSTTVVICISVFDILGWDLRFFARTHLSSVRRDAPKALSIELPFP